VGFFDSTNFHYTALILELLFIFSLCFSLVCLVADHVKFYSKAHVISFLYFFPQFICLFLEIGQPGKCVFEGWKPFGLKRP
jgi:hypothetical protein